MRDKPTNTLIIHSVYYLRMVAPTWYVHHVTRHNMPNHNILSTVPQLSISQKALGTLLENGNVTPKHVGFTTHN
jgi:hypothetical protein